MAGTHLNPRGMFLAEATGIDMSNLRALFSVVLVAGGLISLAPIDALHRAPAQGAGADQATLAAFNTAAASYAALHRLLEQTSPTIGLSRDPGEISRATSALREKIRTARRSAREGEIFSPAAAELFKRLIAQGCDRDFDALLRETADEPEPLGPAEINERWPGAALTMMPPDLLAIFPPLPRGLEYRFVHRDLVLWDVDVDLVVDVLRNAIPASGGNPS